MKRYISSFRTVAHLTLAVLLLAGCGSSSSGGGGSGDTTAQATFRVDLLNVTANQPLSPLAVILHGASFTGWEFGAPVSSGLEKLAEGGDPSAFLSEAQIAGARDNQSGSGVIAPGATSSVTVEGVLGDALLTVATMLANTNDAFTGVSSVEVGDLALGETRSWDLFPLDAGTEVNTELASTIPGPAGGGQGFNAVRDDRGFVSIHPGVITSDDGLVTSALDESHRFQGPVARLTVTRTK